MLQTWCVIIEAHAGVRCAVPLLSGVAGGGREGGGDDGECRGAMRPGCKCGGQGASVVAAPGRMRWGPRSAGVDEPDVSRLQCACGGKSGCERQRAEVTQPPMSKLIDAVVCVTGHKCAVARRPSDPEDVSKLVRPSSHRYYKYRNSMCNKKLTEFRQQKFHSQR